MKEEAQIIFKGRVQGVGFRWTVQDHAERYGLTGTVCNMPSGSVEVIVQGSKEKILSFVEAVKAEPGSASIEAVKTAFRSPELEHNSFRIIC